VSRFDAPTAYDSICTGTTPYHSLACGFTAMAQIKLQDIADHLGLAKATVAGVLRDQPGFSEKTRQRVKAAALKMGYQRNPLGAALAGGRSMSISLLIGSLDPVLLERLHA